MRPWIGAKEIAFVLADVKGGLTPAPPPNWDALARDRIFSDLDPTSGVDRSLRAYIQAVSYGLADLTGKVYGPYTVPWDPNGCGFTMDNAIRAAGVPDAGNAANRATLAAQGSITGYSFACTVFPGHECGAWAFWGKRPGHYYPATFSWSSWSWDNTFGGYYPMSTLTGACYVSMDSGLGTWAMENTHIVTDFDDLYSKTANPISDPPGAFDNMACNCGTHPSSFTKMKMGWVRPKVISASPSDTTVTLHALSEPLVAGREHTVRILSQNSLAYLLVEARLRTDPYEQATPSLSNGIPS